MDVTAVSDLFVGAIRALFVAGMAGAALFDLFSQHFSRFIQWGVVAIGVAIFVYFPEAIVSVGEALATALTGGQ